MTLPTDGMGVINFKILVRIQQGVFSQQLQLKFSQQYRTFRAMPVVLTQQSVSVDAVVCQPRVLHSTTQHKSREYSVHFRGG